MAYKYRGGYKARKLARQSRRNFLITLFLIALLIYAAISWILPFIINSMGFIKNNLSPQQKVVNSQSPNSSFAPPVLNIPYEATNTAQINIRGYGTPSSKVALFLDDEKKDIVDVLDDGAFEFKDVELVLGTNNIYGKSIDEKDQESLSSKSLKIIYDNEKPSLNIAEPEDGKKIQGGDKKVRIAGNAEVGSQVYINGSLIIVDKDGNFLEESSINEGDNDFSIKAVDKASNYTEIQRKVIYIP